MPDTLTAAEALDVLATLMHHSESDPTRLGAAKTVLERIAPKEDEELKRREAEERDAAINEARVLLAELAAAKLARFFEPLTLDQIGPPGSADAADHTAP